MNARANTLEALQIAAGSPRMYCCSALDEQLMRTHRRLLMRLGSGRDTLVWQSRIDAPPAVVWQAAAASIETFFSNVPNVERVEPINGTDSREGINAG